MAFVLQSLRSAGESLGRNAQTTAELCKRVQAGPTMLMFEAANASPWRCPS